MVYTRGSCEANRGTRRERQALVVWFWILVLQHRTSAACNASAACCAICSAGCRQAFSRRVCYASIVTVCRYALNAL